MAIVVHISHVLLYILYSVVLGTNLLIYTPIIMYYCIRFWKLRKEAFFSKRHPYLVLMITFSFQLWSNISLPLSSPFSWPLNNIHIFHYIPSIAMHFFYSITIMILIRFCLLYFDYTYALQLKARRWQKNISHSTGEISFTQPWTLKYRYLTKPKFLISLLIILTIFAEVVLELHLLIFVFTVCTFNCL